MHVVLSHKADLGHAYSSAEGEILDPVWMTWWHHLGPRSEPRLPHQWNGVDSCGTQQGGKDGAGFFDAKNWTNCWLLCPRAAWLPPLPSSCSDLPSRAISPHLCSPHQSTEMRLPRARLRTQPAPSGQVAYWVARPWWCREPLSPQPRSRWCWGIQRAVPGPALFQ